MPQISPMLGKCDGLVGSKSICSVLERKTTGCRGSPTATQGLPLGVGEGASELDSPLGPQGLGQDRCTSVPKLQGKLPASDY